MDDEDIKIYVPAPPVTSDASDDVISTEEVRIWKPED